MSAKLIKNLKKGNTFYVLHGTKIWTATVSANTAKVFKLICKGTKFVGSYVIINSNYLYTTTLEKSLLLEDLSKCPIDISAFLNILYNEENS